MRRRSIKSDQPNDAAPTEGGSTLEVLYRRYSGWLTAKLRERFGSSFADPEDLVQETYLLIAPYQRDRVIRYPQAFLMRVASNLAHKKLLRTTSAAASTAAAAVAYDPEREAGHDAAQLEALLYKQVVLAIPQPYRDVFMLSRFGNLTHGEIADHLGVSIKTVEWRMSQALAFCARRLKD